MCPRDYFTAITGVEWPKGKRVWEWDGQWTVPSPLHSALPWRGLEPGKGHSQKKNDFLFKAVKQVTQNSSGIYQQLQL